MPAVNCIRQTLVEVVLGKTLVNLGMVPAATIA